MGCILTNRHTAHSIVSLADASKLLESEVNSKFKTTVPDSLKQITTLVESIEEKLI